MQSECADSALRRCYNRRMLVNSIHYTVAPEEAEKAAAMFRELRDVSRKEEGVISFAVGRSQEQPNVFALWEEYRDKAAFEAHVATDHFERLVINGIRPLAQQRNAAMVVPL